MKKSHIFKGILLNNIGFSAGMFVMYLVMVIVVFFSLLLPGSVRSALDNFITDYRLADAWITVAPMGDPPTESLKKIDGISGMDLSFAIDADMIVNGEDGYSARIFSISDDDTLRIHTYSEDENKTPDSVGMTQRFAETHSVSVGDTVTLRTPNGNVDLNVGSIVTTPEAISCSVDDLAQNDQYGFCYLYLPREEFDEIFGTEGMVNRFSLYFNDGTTTEEMTAAVKSAEEILGRSVVSSVVFETSQFRSSIKSELDAFENTVRFTLFIIFFIGICFSSFFAYQIVDRERRTIGLLRALGYSKSKVFFLFFRYIGGLSVIAAVAGGIIGCFLVGFAADVYLKRFSIPSIVFEAKPSEMILFFSIYFISVFLSCLFSSGKISGVNPCEAYGGGSEAETDTSNRISRLALPVFMKITVTTMWRHKWRQLAASMCIAVCIMLMIMSVATKASEKQAVPATFGSRLLYDVMLRISDDAGTLQSISDNENTDAVDECIIFRSTISFNGKKESTMINAINGDHELLELSDSSGCLIKDTKNGILLDEWFAGIIGAKVGDIVTVDSLELEVTGLVNEYIDSTQYVSYETAALLGHPLTNTALVRLKDPSDQRGAIKKYKQLEGVNFGTSMASYRNSCEDNFKPLGTVLDIFAVLSVLLGTIIIYNMVMLNLNEKKIEYATLLALGIRNREIFTMAFVENILEYIPAVVLAIPLGMYSALTLMTIMSTDMHSYPMYHMAFSVVISCILSLLYIFMGVFLTIRRVKRIDPALSLNFGE